MESRAKEGYFFRTNFRERHSPTYSRIPVSIPGKNDSRFNSVDSIDVIQGFDIAFRAMLLSISSLSISASALRSNYNCN